VLTVVIPIGCLAKDFNNLKDIIKQSLLVELEMIFVLDTDEEEAFIKLQNLCEAEHLENYFIYECHGRNPGASRNIGITKASGEWIVFCDSDDMPNFKILVEATINAQDNFDVIIGSYEVKNKSLNHISKHLIGYGSESTWDSISLNPGLWRWIIRSSFLKSIKFPELSMGEDQCFILYILQCNPEIKYCQKFFYKYQIGTKNSLTTNLAKIDDLISIIKLELAISEFPYEYINIRNNMIFRQIFTLLKRGNLKTKYKAIHLLLKYIFSISPNNYLFMMKFIFRTLRSQHKYD